MSIQNLIENWDHIQKDNNVKISKLVDNFSDLSKIYFERRNRNLEIGFNIFTIISDYYYRENFHSDILKSILEFTKESTLSIFFQMINSAKKNINIKGSDFTNVEFFREKERIDILIIDDYSKKAIIIENKINNAGDTERQLPKYFEKISHNYEVVAIVYLTLNNSKTPHKLDWTDEEIKNLESIIVLIPSMSENSINLLDNFLKPAILNVNQIDHNSIIRQYSKLIQYINHNSMDSISLEKFRDTILQNDNLKTAISINNMLKDLPEYMAIRIEEKYNQNCFPFKNVWRYKYTTTVFEAFEFDNLYFKLDIQCSLNGYRAVFWNNQLNTFETKEKFKDLVSLKDFQSENEIKSHIVKHFEINEEEKLFNFINLLKTELAPYKK